MKRIFRTAIFALALGSMAASFQACTDEEGNSILDEVSADEVIETAGLKIKANSNGTIQFIGDVSSNAKIKTFELKDASGKVVYDFVASNDQVKDKLKDIAEDGKVTKEKIFSLKDITSDQIPVDLYTLEIKTKKAETKVTLGEVLDYKIGAKESNTGSYLSIVNNEAFNMATAKTKASEVIAESSADGKSVIGLKNASKAADPNIAAAAGKVALFQNGAAADMITEGGVIITASGCICKVNTIQNDASGDATVKAVTIKKTATANFDVDVNGYTFSK